MDTNEQTQEAEGGDQEAKLGKTKAMASTIMRFKHKESVEQIRNLHKQIFYRMTEFGEFKKTNY